MLREGFYRALSLIGNAHLLMPLGIGDHIAVGKIGVAAQLMALLQNNDLLSLLGCPNRRNKTGAGANHHHITGKVNGIVLGHHGGSFGDLMAGAGMTYLGAKTALDTLVLIDLIFGSHKVDGLHGTVAGAVVTAGAQGTVDDKHGVNSFPAPDEG